MGFKTRVKGGERRDETAVTCNGRLLHRWADSGHNQQETLCRRR